MGWRTTAELDRFAAAAGGYLRSRAAENTLLLSAAYGTPQHLTAQHGTAQHRPSQHSPSQHATVRHGPAGSAVGRLFGWWEPSDGSSPRGAFLHDTQVPLLIAGRTPEMATALAALVAKTGRPVCGVDAPVEAADAFAAAWRQRAGTVVRLHRSCRVYRLVPASAGAADAPGPAGRLRVAEAADRELVAEWLAAFAAEAGERIGSSQDLADDLIGYGGAVFWEVQSRTARLSQAVQFLAPRTSHRDAVPQQDADYQPVAIATLTRPVAGTVRISMVYTLPDRRRSGYAAAITFAVSRAVLDGAVLHTTGLRTTGLGSPELGSPDLNSPDFGSPGPDSPALGSPALDGERLGRERLYDPALYDPALHGPVTQVVLITDGSGPDRRVSRLGYQLVDERAVLRFGPPTDPVPRLNSASRPMPRLPTGPLPRLRRQQRQQP